MLLSRFIEKLTTIYKEQGDLDVCLASQAWGQYVLLTDSEVSIHDNVYAVDDEEEIAPGYENGKKAVLLGNL